MEEEIPVPTEWESNTFSAVLRFRSAPDPPSPSRSDTFSSGSSSYTSSVSRPASLRRLLPFVVLTLSVYTYYAKRITVGGLGSQTRTV